jgi:hypothetical protein
LGCTELLDRLSNELKELTGGISEEKTNELLKAVKNHAQSLFMNNDGLTNADSKRLIGVIPGGSGLAHFHEGSSIEMYEDGKDENGMTQYSERPHSLELARELGYKWSAIIASRMFISVGATTRAEQTLAMSAKVQYFLDGTFTYEEYSKYNSIRR